MWNWFSQWLGSVWSFAWNKVGFPFYSSISHYWSLKPTKNGPYFLSKTKIIRRAAVLLQYTQPWPYWLDRFHTIKSFIACIAIILNSVIRNVEISGCLKLNSSFRKIQPWQPINLESETQSGLKWRDSRPGQERYASSCLHFLGLSYCFVDLHASCGCQKTSHQEADALR